MIEDQKPIPNPDINTGDLVLVKDHTSKTFMPKYKSDFRVIRVLGNKVEVKDNNGKMSWYHISDVKKTDMVTKLICQLPDYNAFGRVGRLSFNPERVQDLDGLQMTRILSLIQITFQIHQLRSRDLTQCS